MMLPPIPAGGIEIARTQIITQAQLNAIRAGAYPYYRLYGVVGYRITGSHSTARRVAMIARGEPVTAFEVAAAVNSLPGASLSSVNAQIAAIHARDIQDASGGFLRDAVLGAAIFTGAGFLGAAALAGAGAATTATPALVAASDAPIVTAAVDTGSTLATTALGGGAAGGGGGFLATAGEYATTAAEYATTATAGAKGATQLYGQVQGLRGLLGGKHPQGGAPAPAPVYSTPPPAPVSPAPILAVVAAGLGILFHVL